MGRRCLILGCTNRYDSKKKSDELDRLRKDVVHSFPAPVFEEQRKLWLAFAELACGDELLKLKIDNFGICDRHFTPADFEVAANGMLKLKRNSVPTTMLPEQPDTAGPDIECCSPKETFHIEIQSTKQDLSTLQSELYLSKLTAYNLEKKYQELMKRNLELEEANRHLESELTRSTIKEIEINEKLKNILDRFAPGQQRILMNPHLQHTHWSDEDVIKALSLYSISKKAYSLAKDSWSIPLPSISTLKTHLSKFPIVPDKPFPFVFKALNTKFVDAQFNSLDTQVILGLDEIGIDHRFCYDTKLDQIFGGEKNATVFCARSLCSGTGKSWKMPLMYTFNQTSTQLIQLIQLLYENGLNVVGCVSDMGPKNQKIWKDFGMGKVEKGVITKISFNHPITGQSIYWFPDFPHLLKLFRDHLLETRITLSCGTVVDKSWISNLINMQRGEAKLTFKLNQKILNIKGQQKQDVKTAFHLFSSSTAAGVRVLLSEREGFEKVADFFDLVNDVTDLLNSRIAGDYFNKYKCAYGIYLKEQSELLKRALECFSSMIVGYRRNKSFAPFQKGLIWNIQSLQALHENLSNRLLLFVYILTKVLNQDYIENLFSILRSYGGQQNNPTPVQLRHRLRKLIFTWSIASGDFDDFKLDDLKILEELDPETLNSEQGIRPTFNDQVEEELSVIDTSLGNMNDFTFESMSSESIVAEGSKEYIAGYIAKKLMESYPELCVKGAEEVSRSFWVAALSKGGLTEPSSVWFAIYSKFEEYFDVIHPRNTVCREPGIVHKLTCFLKERHPEIQCEILKFYAHCRTMIRIKYLNVRMEDEKILERERKRNHINQVEDDEVNFLSVDGEDRLY